MGFCQFSRVFVSFHEFSAVFISFHQFSAILSSLKIRQNLFTINYSEFDSTSPMRRLSASLRGAASRGLGGNRPCSGGVAAQQQAPEEMFKKPSRKFRQELPSSGACLSGCAENVSSKY